MPEDYMDGFLKELRKKIKKIGRQYEIINIEVTEDIWNNLMRYEDFRKQAERQNANIGGYKIIKGKKFKIQIIS
jgi:deoxyadenosine/deoxycytidine kinase